MKKILRWFPRPFLIQMSLLFQPLLRLLFRGNTFTDPIDGSSYVKFLPYGYGEHLRPNALCPGTLSLERHRLLWLYLKRHSSFLKKPIKVLHVAPEQIFLSKFKKIQDWDYITTDLHSPLATVRADLCNLPFEEEQFDLILCNHVLEHIEDDIKAMQELFRVLKKGGTLIAQVPMDENSAKTLEDFNIVKPQERAAMFGQYDHVRIYGLDFFDRLEKVGFRAIAVLIQDQLKASEIKRFALQPKEKIPVATKP